jgi:hypothetical protein
MAARSAEEQEYIDDLANAMLAAFGYSLDDEEALAWLEADATVDQAVEWTNHGCGPGDYAGCADKEGAWL